MRRGRGTPLLSDGNMKFRSTLMVVMGEVQFPTDHLLSPTFCVSSGKARSAETRVAGPSEDPIGSMSFHLFLDPNTCCSFTCSWTSDCELRGARKPRNGLCVWNAMFVETEMWMWGHLPTLKEEILPALPKVPIQVNKQIDRKKCQAPSC